MNKLIKLASIAFYLLMLLTFFILGMYFAYLIEAGKNQGLAGGAIVLGWGVLFAGIGFLGSILLARFLSQIIVVRLNWILLVVVLLTYGLTYYRFSQRDKQNEETPVESPKKVTALAAGNKTAMHNTNEIENLANKGRSKIISYNNLG